MNMLYIGNGAFLPGVPARDLTEEEAKKYDINFLLASGLYKFPDLPAVPPKKSKRLESVETDGGK
jgi:hypothetical protein